MQSQQQNAQTTGTAYDVMFRGMVLGILAIQGSEFMLATPRPAPHVETSDRDFRNASADSAFRFLSDPQEHEYSLDE